MEEGSRTATRGEGEAYELDEDTRVEPVTAGRYKGRVSGRWGVGLGPNGGYLAALLLRAVLAEASLPDPLTMTVHYLSRPLEGECDLAVTPLREGRGHAAYRVELSQAGEIRCASLVTLGRLRAAGPHDFQPEPPELAPPESCSRLQHEGEISPLWNRVDQRVVRPEDVYFLRREPGPATTGGWTRLTDGRPSDAMALALFLDCWPPAVFGRIFEPDPIGVPTIEYTVHWRNRPASQWSYVQIETRALTGGYVDELGQAFDEKGVLLAESRQLARYGGGTGR